MTHLYQEISTPALLVDEDTMLYNLHRAQDIADKNSVALRPHTKTHKTPALAKLQVEIGAKGIAVAKIAEAEIMAEAGLDDIFVANEPVGTDKLARLRALAERVTLSFGVDCIEHVRAANEAFAPISTCNLASAGVL